MTSYFKVFLIRLLSILKLLYLQGKLKLFFALLSFLFVSYSIYKNSSNITQLSLDTNTYLFLIIAFFITIFSLIINALAWKYLIYFVGFDKLDINLIKLYLQTNLLKYIPGGVWHFAERIRILKSDISSFNSLLVVSLEPFLMLIAALFWIPFGGLNLTIRTISLLTLSILLVAKLRNTLLKNIFCYVKDKFINNNIIDSSTNFSIDKNIQRGKLPLKALIIEILFLLSRFIGFWFCLKAFGLSNSLFFFDWLSSFCLAWAIGLIVPGSPGGIGVFEAIFLLLIGNLVFEASILSTLICYRLVSTFADVAAYMFARLINKEKSLLF